MAELTDKEKLFADKYIECLNGTEACVFAGYSEKSARTLASRLLAKDNISAYIKSKQSMLSEKLEISTEWVIKRFKEISDRCMQAVPVMVFDPVEKKMIQKKDCNGEGVWEFDSAGANKATEMIGKHLGSFEKDNNQKALTILDATKFAIKRR